MPRKAKPNPFIPMCIAYCIDWRGRDNNRLTFVFRGATSSLLAEVFGYLAPLNGKGIAKDYDMYPEHDCCHRNGKGYRRIAVELVEPDFFFCGIDDMCLLLEARLHAETECSVTRLTLEKFLNV